MVATDTQTGVQTTQETDAKGFYNLPTLAVGTYDLEIKHVGFKTFRQTGLVIDANSALRADASLDVGSINEKVEVSTEVAQVEPQSTQMGEVIEGSKMTSVPLNGRSFIDLLVWSRAFRLSMYLEQLQRHDAGRRRGRDDGIRRSNRTVLSP